jgi:hypothetical protein
MVSDRWGVNPCYRSPSNFFNSFFWQVKFLNHLGIIPSWLNFGLTITNSLVSVWSVYTCTL